jgi:hypothetical protein
VKEQHSAYREKRYFPMGNKDDAKDHAESLFIFFDKLALRLMSSLIYANTFKASVENGKLGKLHKLTNV